MDFEFERNKQHEYKEVAFRDKTIARENLPFPIVLYPGHYGTFFAFKKDSDSSIFLCSCAKVAIENCIRLHMTDTRRHKKRLLNTMDFPKSLVNILQQQSPPNDLALIDYLLFQSRLCHECNKSIPSYKYCVEMYGGAFKQNLGWYINKQAYEFGIDPWGPNILRDRCPQEILELIKLDLVDTPELYRKLILTERDRAKALWKEFNRQHQKIWNIIESEVRLKFGHKRVGEAWTSETILYNIICSLFPDKKIIHHYRPDFLQGLELDIFIDDFKLGIEYQGIQHFEPIEHWGGEESLRELKQRDKTKKQICDSLNIALVYFNHDEDLSNELVFSKLEPYLKSKSYL